jgi:hypothetical protein
MGMVKVCRACPQAAQGAGLSASPEKSGSATIPHASQHFIQRKSLHYSAQFKNTFYPDAFFSLL